MSPRVHATFAVFATVLVAAAMAWGFKEVGSPYSRRTERFDERRLEDLRTISREIETMVVEQGQEKKTLKAELPHTLGEASVRARNERLSVQDPETGEPYTYTVQSETTFELCATFARQREWTSGVFWNHPAGTHCFRIDVLDPPPFY